MYKYQAFVVIVFANIVKLFTHQVDVAVAIAVSIC